MLADRCDYVRLASLGHHGMMMPCTRSGEIAEAIGHGWAAFQARVGSSAGQVEVLSNIGQLFLEAGHPKVARQAFVRVLATVPTPRVAGPALGGYALASAVLGDRTAVRWSAAEAAALSDQPGIGYESASALIDCASALDLISEAPYGAVLRARASTIAQYSGFHELVHKAEAASQTSAPIVSRPLSGAPEFIASEISKLPESVLPDHLELVSV